MPINATPEYLAAQKQYEEARAFPDKIKWLNEMIRLMPKHKGTEKLHRQLTTRLTKFKEEQVKAKKAGKRHSIAVKKEGFQIVIIGFPNAGKSTLLKKLTNADPKIADYPFTTKNPEIGMLNYEGAQLQLIEVPALVEGAAENQGELMSIIMNSDGAILIYNDEKEVGVLLKELKEFGVDKKIILINREDEIRPKEVFEFFNLIRVYTKEPGEEPVFDRPMILPKGSTVLEAGKEVHKDFYKKLKYACVWGSSKFPGQRVEKEYILKDKDVVEFHV